ncbi:DUF350 domain-containing protein [Spirochaeta cellobiosiphila]|uniref:DUF350 domain-containing protein n=1 Tax=Spirochaeta cellobiosiphila TaxID=504483 RepID=UPI0003FC5374|nr:DUF350 domain-containing protein [Spirochaeta cellobiosiphila]
MDIIILLSGIITVLIAIVLGVFILYFGFTVFGKFNRNINEKECLLDNNIAVAIVSGAMIFSIGYIFKSSLIPLVQSLFRIAFHPSSSYKTLLIQIIIILIQFGITLFISILSLWLGLKVFTALTRDIDEFEEIKNNNIAIAILMGVVIITLALFIEEGIDKLLQVLMYQPGIQNQSLTPFG